MQTADRPHWKRTAATAIAALVIACSPVLAQPASPAPGLTVAEAPTVDALKRILQRSDDAASAATALADLTTRAAVEPEAAYVLGNLYFNGAKAVPRDYAKAEPLMQAAAAAGDPRALFKLGEIYRRGEDFDSALAMDYYRQAADLGDAGAAYRVGEYYRTGAGGVAEDRALALQYYHRAEQAGDTTSLIRLGDLYRSGAELGLDPALAVDYYQRAAAADNATALVRLGDIYRTGIAGVAADPATAIDYYQQAIAAGNAAVTLKLADGYLDGSLGGSPAQGTELLQQAIADGTPGAAVALARAHLAGETIPQNTAAALDVLKTALAAGDAEAGRALIRLYVDGGDGLPRNLRAARTTLDAVAPALDAPALAFETLILDIAQRPSTTGYPALLANFVQLSSQGKRTALSRAYGLDRNAYVYFFQERLAELGYYQGNPNGLLTSATISAFNQACAAMEIVDDCRTGPLSYNARRSSQQALF